MKKSFLLVGTLFFTLFSFSQTPETGEDKKLNLGVYFSYDNDLGPKQIVFDRDSGYEQDDRKANFSAGLSLEYPISKSLAVVSGIGYLNRSFTGNFYCHVCDFVRPPSPEKIELQYVEVPVMGRYYFLTPGLKVFGEAGFSNLFKVNSETRFGQRSYLAGAKVGGGIIYPFYERYSLQLSADYTQSVTKVFEEADYDYRILGIKVGLNVEL